MIPDEHIGGAFVRRPFERRGERLPAGHRLAGGEVRDIPIANRRALIDSGYLEVWPTPPDDALAPLAPAALPPEASIAAEPAPRRRGRPPGWRKLGTSMIQSKDS